MLKFDLLTESEQLRSERAWSSGRNAKTLVKHADSRLVLTVMRAGTRMHQHHARGTVSVQAVAGHLKVHVLDGTFDLRAGQILSLDPNLPHHVEAIEDSAFLLGIAWRGDSRIANPSTRSFEVRGETADWRQDESVWD